MLSKTSNQLQKLKQTSKIISLSGLNFGFCRLLSLEIIKTDIIKNSSQNPLCSCTNENFIAIIFIVDQLIIPNFKNRDIIFSFGISSTKTIKTRNVTAKIRRYTFNSWFCNSFVSAVYASLN